MQELIDKKDARILWNTDDKGSISEILVEEFTEKHNPQHLYKSYIKDIGNCESDWDEQTLLEIIVGFGLRSRNEQEVNHWIKIVNELLKIKEFNKELKPLIRQNLRYRFPGFFTNDELQY